MYEQLMNFFVESIENLFGEITKVDILKTGDVSEGPISGFSWGVIASVAFSGMFSGVAVFDAQTVLIMKMMEKFLENSDAGSYGDTYLGGISEVSVIIVADAIAKINNEYKTEISFEPAVTLVGKHLFEKPQESEVYNVTFETACGKFRASLAFDA